MSPLCWTRAITSLSKSAGYRRLLKRNFTFRASIAFRPCGGDAAVHHKASLLSGCYGHAAEPVVEAFTSSCVELVPSVMEIEAGEVKAPDGLTREIVMVPLGATVSGVTATLALLEATLKLAPFPPDKVTTEEVVQSVNVTLDGDA